MRIKEKEIKAVAEVIRPYLSDVIVSKGVISNDDLKAAIKEARADGHPLPQLQSNRSLGIVEAELVGD